MAESAKTAARGILVVDPDTAFLETVAKDPKNTRVPSFTFSTVRDAQLCIADKTKQLMALFINPVLPTVFDPALIRHAHHYRPATPIYLLHDNPLPLSEKEFDSIGVQNLVRKPVTYSQIVDIADPPRFSQSIALAHATEENVGEEVQDDTEKGFKAIRAADFISGSKSFFDIYIQLGGKRYLKIVKAGDVFDPERVVSYIKKGVKFFYIRQAAQESYLIYCDQIAKILIDNNKVSAAAKVSQVLNYGEELTAFFRDNGITESTLQYATKYVGHIHQAIDRIELDRFAAIKTFLADVAALEHSNAVAMLASLMMKPLKFSDPDTLNAVGLACMFHDLGLQGASDNVRSEDLGRMTPEEQEAFKQHPSASATQLSDLKKVSEAVVQAVQQHHERRTRKGFPHGLGAGSINGLAEIVGICDEFVNALKKSKERQNMNPLRYMEEQVFDGFSTNVVEAFRLALFKK